MWREALLWWIRGDERAPPPWQRASLGLLVAIALGYSFARLLLEIAWIPLFSDWSWYLSAGHNYLIYGLLLTFGIATTADLWLSVTGGRPRDPEKLRELLGVSVVFWAVGYPLVAAFSMLTGSPFFRSVEVFTAVPGFMRRYNFLPSGMLVTIALMFWRLPLAMRRIYGVGYGRGALALLVATLPVYLVFYQWLLHVLYVFVAWDRRLGHVAFFCAYSLAMIAYVSPLVPRLLTAFPEVRARRVWATLAVLAVTFVLMPKFGVLHILHVKRVFG